MARFTQFALVAFGGIYVDTEKQARIVMQIKMSPRQVKCKKHKGL